MIGPETQVRRAIGLIERISSIEDAVGARDDWDEDISHLTTWQVQQLRRAARLRSRLPWRDQQVEANHAMQITWDELMRRGAIAAKAQI